MDRIDQSSDARSRSRLIRFAWLSTCMGATVLATPAVAQDTNPTSPLMEGPGAEDEIVSSDEIVVTASRRNETVLDLPISISAFSGAELRELGVTASTDVAAKVPNVTFRTAYGFSQPQYYIRGLGNRNFQNNVVSPVAVYSDGIVMGSSLSQSFQALDLERVEILRGPQGTLYGRNASAGLLNFISVQPDPGAGVSGFATASYGKFDLISGEAAVNIPLTDTLAVRGAFLHRQRDGVFTDGTGLLGRDPGHEQVHQYRVTLGYYGDGFEATARVRGFNIDSDQRPFKQIGTLGPRPFCPSVELNQTCTDRFGFSDSSDPYEANLSFIGYEKGKSDGVDIQATFDLSPSLSLVAAVAHEEAENHRWQDEDYSPNSAFNPTYDTTVNFSSAELRLQSKGNAEFQWMLGGYYYREKLHQWLATISQPLFGVDLGIPLNQRTKSFAGFANAELNLTDRLSVRGGIRLTYDRREGDARSFIFDGSPAYFFKPIPEDEALDLFVVNVYNTKALGRSWTEPSGEVTLSYKPSSEWHIYGTFSAGFKGGEFNGGFFSATQTVLVDPEFVYNKEIGVKGRAFNGRLSGELSVFRMDITDQQVSALQSIDGVPSLVLSNAANSRLQGIEVNLEARIVGGLSMQGSLGLLDAKYRSYPDAPGGDDYTGNRLVYAPKVTANATLRYEDYADFGEFAAQLTGRYSSKMFDQPSNVPNQIVKAFYTVDGSVRVEPSALPGLSAQIWVKNLLDREYWQTFYSSGGSGYNALGIADPRTFGITVGYQFD